MYLESDGRFQDQVFYQGAPKHISTNVDPHLIQNQVSSSELNKFHAAYGTLLKSSMGELRKRDKKREKANAEQAAKRKKRMTEPVTVEGPKRGNRRRKRQRQLKAALKQQESQKKFKEREEARKKVEVALP